MLSTRNIIGWRFDLYILWVIFFAYTTSVALVFQSAILPLIPSMHAGGGLMFGDAIYFHQTAVSLAETIAKDGWMAWQPWPPPNAHGNTAVLAALYYIFGVNPAVVVPINAAMHATSAILLILIANALTHDRVARTAAVFGAIIFIVLPSTLNWNGQVHKDGYAILGIFLMFYSGTLLFNPGGLKFYMFRMLASIVSGIALTVFVRPNNLLIFMIPAVFMLLFSLRYFRDSLNLILMRLFYVFVIVLAAISVHPDAHEAQINSGTAVFSTPGEVELKLSRFNEWRWEKTDSIPSLLDRVAERAASLRVFMSAYGARENARSMIDIDIIPKNFVESLAYLPRSIVIGLFAPFPNIWREDMSLTRLLGIAEIAVWYTIFPGLLWFLWVSRHKRQVWWVLASTLGILALESFITSNLGTLHRIRYPFLSLLILFGAMGWGMFLQQVFNLKTNFKSKGFAANLHLDTPGIPEIEVRGDGGGRKMLTRGIMVVFLTGCVYAGLFFRDLLLARTLGLGRELDVIQLGSFYTLSAAGLLAVPFGPVLINVFMEMRENKGKDALLVWISAMSAMMLSIFFLVALLIGCALFFGQSAEVLGSMNSEVFYDVLPMLLAVVALSGSVVLGNAVLSASGRAELATAAQLVVPAFSIIFIALFAYEWGARAAAFGLLAGQIANYFLIRFALRSLGYSFRPCFGQTYWRGWLGQYLPLVAASALTVIAIPVGVYLSSGLPEGSVGAFSLGAKVIQFATGLVSAGLIAVVLPHFAKLSAMQRFGDLRKSLAFFLVVGSAVSVPVSLAMSALGDGIASLLFGGGRITPDAIVQLGAVIRYTSLQFPFFVVMAVLVKFTLASRAAAWVFVAALLGQCVNFVLGGLLVNNFGVAGVAGVAVAMTCGVLISSFFILVWAWLKGHVPIVLFVLIGVTWLLFLTLAICIHYGNILGMFACSLAFLMIFLSQFRFISPSYRG